jgi:Na+-translocating ferredoxin:NAD+ oxidoreductase RNF subunit RnfB
MKTHKQTLLKNSSGASDMAENKFQLQKCPRGGLKCRSHLAEINRLFKNSQNYLQSKDYQFSVQVLERAFKETYKLKESTCINCAKLFRAEIIDTVNNIHEELTRMSHGIFGKRYLHIAASVERILSELSRKDEEIKYAQENVPFMKYGT